MHESISIALLSQTGETGRHLRDALMHVGTPIVYEAAASDLDRDALERSGARVVVVNLDPDVESHLDDVYALLDDDRYNVIFNEAQVSSQLSGWEQARWARHLVAKITGAENADPPRPEGAEAVPQRVVASAIAVAVDVVASNEAFDEPPAPAVAQAVPESMPEPAIELKSAAPDVADDFSDIVSLLQEVEPGPAPDSAPANDSAKVDIDTMFATVPMPVLDLSAFDDEPDAIDVPDAVNVPTAVEVSAAEFDDLSTLAFEAIVVGEVETETEVEIEIESGTEAEPEAAAAVDGGIGFGDLDDFADDGAEDGPLLDFSFDTEPASPPAAVSARVKGAAPADMAADGAGDIDWELLDLDFADTPPSSEEADSDEPVAAVPAAEIGSAFSWSLEEIDDGESTPNAASPTAQPAEFGIETISASDFLAPESQAPVPQTPLVELELVPIEEAMAPTVATLAHDNNGPGVWLDPDAIKQQVVSNVWVMGASIGGPEAVREFLAELPKDCPALFLLAQHMGPEFVDIMAQQLARAIQLTVRTPTHGERVAHGDIVIVPTTHRLRVNKQGVILLELLPDNTQGNRPSIDQVLNDVADAFGANAGVIVFSGMAEDAAEGSVYLAGIGGRVYVQDPDTCVISSMVDGVIETGVVTFAGSPKALAGKVMGDLKMAARN